MLAAPAGFFPLTEQLEVVAEHFTPSVARQAVWLARLVPYEQAEAILAEIGRVTLSATSIWRRLLVWGQRFAELEAAERAQANALPEKWEPPSRSEVTDQRKGVAMDGFMVHVLKEGWKEIKLGAVFELERRPGIAEGTGEPLELAHAIHTTYVAHLGALRCLASGRGPRPADAAGSRRKLARCSVMAPCGSGTKPRCTLAQESAVGKLVSRQATPGGCSPLVERRRDARRHALA